MTSITSIIRIGTFNVRWADPKDGEHIWDLRKSRLLEGLRAWAPDVLGLQEPVLHQLSQIREALSEYASAGIGREDGLEDGEFCPIFYRSDRFELAEGGTFWFSETPEMPGSRGWGSWHPRICTWVRLKERGSEEAFYVYNMHWDNESQTARENSVKILLDRIGRRTHADPVIVMGDFNAEADNAAVAQLSAADSPVAISALSSVHAEPTGTFHGFTGTPTGMPIDHIFLSPEWRVLDAEVLYGDGERPFLSDHFPLAATLRWL
ncbi:MAG: endonuclease/exonuclease/phosphatase family protein [Janthinobacterium lividum]